MEMLSKNINQDVTQDINQERKWASTRLRVRIPQQYQNEPILSNLIQQHGLTVTIKAALLSYSAREDGWFDLDLQGTPQQLQSAVFYLNDLNVEAWSGEDCTLESW